MRRGIFRYLPGTTEIVDLTQVMNRLDQLDAMATTNANTATAANAAATAADTKATALQQGQVTLSQLASDYTAAVAASVADRQALHDQITALQLALSKISSGQIRRKTATVPAVVSVLGSAVTQDIAIAWTPPMADSAYSVLPAITSTGGLGGKVTAAVKAGSITAQGCTIMVTTTAILSANSCTLDVLAYHD